MIKKSASFSIASVMFQNFGGKSLEADYFNCTLPPPIVSRMRAHIISSVSQQHPSFCLSTSWMVKHVSTSPLFRPGLKVVCKHMIISKLHNCLVNNSHEHSCCLKGIDFQINIWYFLINSFHLYIALVTYRESIGFVIQESLVRSLGEALFLRDN